MFGGFKGGVWLLTLATGEVECVQHDEKDLQGAPTWRQAGELSYMRRPAPAPEGTENARQADLVLRRADGETVVSADWSDEVVNGVVAD